MNFINGNEKLGYQQNVYKGNFIIITNAMNSIDDNFNASKIYLSISIKLFFMKCQRAFYKSLIEGFYKKPIKQFSESYPADYCVEGMMLANPDYAKEDLALAVFYPISDSNFDVFYINFLMKTWKVNYDLLLNGNILEFDYKDLDRYSDEYRTVIDKITNDKYREAFLGFLEKAKKQVSFEIWAYFAKIEAKHAEERQKAAREQQRALRESEERKEKWNDFKRGFGDIFDPNSTAKETKTTTYLGFITTEETREFRSGDRSTLGFKDKNTDYYYKTVNVKK